MFVFVWGFGPDNRKDLDIPLGEAMEKWLSYNVKPAVYRKLGEEYAGAYHALSWTEEEVLFLLEGANK